MEVELRDPVLSQGPNKHVLILGCGRSGTSIFGELFDQLVSYQYYCEPPFDELFRYDYSTPVAVKVPRECSGYLREPLKFARTICQDADVNPDENNLAIEQWAYRVQNSNNERFIEAECSKNYSRPDHNVRIGRWRENLSEQDIQAILPIVQATAELFGYRFDGLPIKTLL